MIYSQSNGIFFIVGKDMSKVNTVIEAITWEFHNINNYAHDFGLTFQHLVSGRDYALETLKSAINDSEPRFGETRNDFERQIISDIADITNCMLTNVTISFTKPSENFEYDILVPIHKSEILDIKITDYQSIREQLQNTETLKSKLILSTSDKAKRLEAEVVIIARGFPKIIYDQINELAKSRGITFLMKQTIEAHWNILF